MKSIAIAEIEKDSTRYDEIVKVLDEGGVVCLPCGGSYRILADLTNIKAVNKLFAAKGRTKKTPSLVLIAERKHMHQVIADPPEQALLLAKKFWPGPLTILFKPNPDLPSKVLKALIKGDGKIGLRVPDKALVQTVLKGLGRPLLVSSANKQKKQGAGSPAQVRKSFFGKIDLFVDAGDLVPSPSSTVLEIKDEQLLIAREGQITLAEIKDSL